MVLGALTNAIPNPFGGFSPFPNSIMIPFMAAQSQALAYGFGLDYEYGKRTIKAMSNEQFNALTHEDVTNLVNERNNEILQQLQAQLPAFTAFQNEIIEKQVQVEVAKANRTPSAMAEIVTALLAGGHQATADAIEQHVSTSEDKNTALQTLSLISPLFALMGLASQSTTTPEEPPQEPHGELYPKSSLKDFIIHYQGLDTNGEAISRTLETSVLDFNAHAQNVKEMYHNDNNCTSPYCEEDQKIGARKYKGALENYYQTDGTEFPTIL